MAIVPGDSVKTLPLIAYCYVFLVIFLEVNIDLCYGLVSATHTEVSDDGSPLRVLAPLTFLPRYHAAVCRPMNI